METILNCQQHTFQLLTKYPERMARSLILKNVWAGVTAENADTLKRHVEILDKYNMSARNTYASIEPIQSRFSKDELSFFDWVIVGCQTGPGAPPINNGHVYSVIDACESLGIPVFAKNNTGLGVVKQWPLSMTNK
jgi:protein gp37